MNQLYPILEFDPSPTAMIEPARVNQPSDVPEHCVICFFRDVLEEVIASGAKVVRENRWEDGSHDLYEIEYEGRRVAFFHPGVGAALAGSLLEEVIAFGCRKFIACGGCGVLNRGMAVGHLVVVASAVRDEGLSYHYLPPARTVAADARAVAALHAELNARALPYVTGTTWTIDAPYRETPDKVALRRAEGCLTVEMEAAAFLAVAQFRGVPLGQLLYGGDDLSGAEWDSRGWQNRSEIRANLFWTAVAACLRME